MSRRIKGTGIFHLSDRGVHVLNRAGVKWGQRIGHGDGRRHYEEIKLFEGGVVRFLELA